jgi:hypothetical protein
VIIVNDWMHVTSIEKFILGGGMPDPESILINGKGFVINNNSDLTASFSVKPGKRYRFRLISAGVLMCPIEFSIEKHQLLVIAMDGSEIEAQNVGTIVVLAGERYDFILEANQVIGSYLIRAKGLADCLKNEVSQTGTINYDYRSDYNATNYNNISILVNIKCYQSLLFLFLIVFLIVTKQLNPLNIKINDSNKHLYMSVDQLRGAENDQNLKYYKKLNNTLIVEVKKLFIQMDFNFIYNVELDDIRSYPTPQINNISFLMPPTPLFYQSKSIPKVLIII